MLDTPSAYPPGLRFRAAFGERDTDDVVYLSGELDLGSIDATEVFAEKALSASTHQRFVVDVTDLSFCGSQGLALFVRLDRAARARGQAFLLRHPEPMLTHLLALTMLDEKLMVEA